MIKQVPATAVSESSSVSMVNITVTGSEQGKRMTMNQKNQGKGNGFGIAPTIAKLTVQLATIGCGVSRWLGGTRKYGVSVPT